jgi:hypothetical protein
MDVPYVTGAASVLGNIGDLRNKGMEISLDAAIIKTKNFSWSINSNWSTNKNVLVKSNISYTKAGTYLANVEGKNFNSFYMPIWAGVDPATGLGQWIDSTGKVTTNYAGTKPQYIGKPNPDGFGALTSDFRFKNFQLSARFYYQYGFKVYMNPDLLNDGARPYGNQVKEALDRWQKPGDIAANPKRTLNNAGGYQISTRRLFDGDYIRFQNIVLAYNLPGNICTRLHLNTLRLYLQADNLAIWTKAQGNDVSDANVQGFTGGSAYPNQRTFSLGINLNF